MSLISFTAETEILAADVNANFAQVALGPTRDFTAGEAINASSGPLALYLKASDGKVYKTDATSGGEATFSFVGFAVAGQNISSNGTISVTVDGIVTGFSGLTAGSLYWLTNSAGAISTSPGSYFKRVGFAVSTTVLRIQIEFDDTWMSSGSIQLAAADTNRSTNNSSYTKLKEIVCGRDGYYTVSFDIWCTNTIDTINGRVYRNGVAYGTEQSTTSSIEDTKTEDLYFYKGDLIQLYIKKNSAGTANCRRFRIGASAYDGFRIATN